MEAIILVLDMGVMLYLCWRIFRSGNMEDADLGFLRYDKNNERR